VERFAAEPDVVAADVAELGLPVWVKPARLGSSVGIVPVRTAGDLGVALATAFEHDPLAIVEADSRGLEVECSVMGNGDPVASEPGEIMLAAGEQGWYDYEAKYTPGGMQLIVPARISAQARERVRELAVAAFKEADCAGLARVDFFIEGEDVLINELNTIPGFTETSVYSSLFEASGMPYAEQLERLVTLAIERHQSERAFRF
jgi:D-alanine-D-alanine ligase